MQLLLRSNILELLATQWIPKHNKGKKSTDPTSRTRHKSPLKLNHVQFKT